MKHRHRQEPVIDEPRPEPPHLVPAPPRPGPIERRHRADPVLRQPVHRPRQHAGRDDDVAVRDHHDLAQPLGQGAGHVDQVGNLGVGPMHRGIDDEPAIHRRVPLRHPPRHRQRRVAAIRHPEHMGHRPRHGLRDETLDRRLQSVLVPAQRLQHRYPRRVAPPRAPLQPQAQHRRHRQQQVSRSGTGKGGHQPPEHDHGTGS
jgi:hypothetical protein